MGAKPSFPLVSLPRERVVIVTGGNTGLGYEIAKWVAIMGATVIIACRSEERATEAITRMNAQYKDLKQKNKPEEVKIYERLAVEFMPLDLSSFTSTEKFADDFKKSDRPLHILVCNAGIGMAPFEQTEDGFEKMLQVNYLGHFLLTGKLLPVMLKSGEDCRIIYNSSDAHRTCSFDMDTINYSGNPNKFSRLDYYGRSKLYQIMQTYCMTRRLRHSNVTVNASHPGIVRTEITRNFSDLKFWKFFFFVSDIFGKVKEPLEGATSVINGVVNPDLKGVSGQYYYDCKDDYKTATARDERKQEMLWKKTLEFLQDRLTEDEIRCLEGR